jgi:hypothetical protein
MAFEHVHAVWAYYDGPRSGVADYTGQPHHYHCEWDNAADDYSRSFALTPLDAETLSLTDERESIWREWEKLFHRGKVAQSTHPALPGQHPRYQDLTTEINARLAAISAPRKYAQAVFRALPGQETRPQGVMRELEVEWSEPPITP